MKKAEILDEIWEVIEDRAINPSEDSYTTRILTHRKGIDKSLEKVGEECSEFIIAVKNGEKSRITEEAADVIFHLMLALKRADIHVQAVWDELNSRRH
ncbi:phosphoribosyl-ATP diphosphatase [Methanospirillum sp. J.3.6.1-F.2.7.3]|uniref:Phosphoribosyl-ATP pyrophosphatase n=2 Tax=Methanospirillum TaxID=2202 RepID=A0A8E7AZI8_9EURY|nr:MULTISPECIES: phosphoribosyl-ATP diphosphatase [Methanospirillum]MDX8551059.1 phosphoribosyl-ATP diphosphatase [Methanospirillum hungatei]QVV87632.1 phosphoribosyl-ATP diphosphatase [Methanospirillum sp. J.3.6.1-F.2.7.3]QXO95095.1 phosphoribosyl-ATP diphosphatase [Methanospirillum hungatei]